MPTQHFSRYYAQVTPDGMHAIFGMQIPRIFAEVFSRVLTELDPSEQDFAAILSAMRHSTNAIALEHENFDNILPPGQVDPLPFKCMQGPIITHVLQLGDERLYKQLASDPNSDPEGLRQSLSIVRIKYKGQEKARLGMAQSGIQVICRPGHPLAPTGQLPMVQSVQAQAQAAASQHQAAANQQAMVAQFVAQQAANQQAAQAAQLVAQQAAAQQAAAQHAAAQHQHAAAQQVAAQQAAAQQAAAQQAAAQAAHDAAAAHAAQVAQQAAAQAAHDAAAAQAAQAQQEAQLLVAQQQQQGGNPNQPIAGALLAESQRRTARASNRGRD